MAYSFWRSSVLSIITVGCLVSPAAAQVLPQRSSAGPDPGKPISGVVQDTQGRPITSASIYLTNVHMGRASSPPSDNYVTARATSDAEGRFEVQRPETFGGTLHIFASGYVPTSGDPKRPRSLPFGTEESTGPEVYTLDKATTVSGTVRDDQGVPLPGAKVIATDATVKKGEPYAEPYVRAASDGDGHFQLAPVPEAPLLVQVSAPGLATAFVDYAPGDTLDVQLGRGRTVSGRVVDFQSRKPTGGVPITLTTSNPGGSQDRETSTPRSWSATVESGDSGMVYFRNVPDGDFLLVVPRSIEVGGPRSKDRSSRIDYRVWNQGASSVPVKVSADAGSYPVDIPVFTGYTVKGQVMESATSKPVPGASVWRMDIYPHVVTTADDQGQFTFDHVVAEGNMRLAVQAEGYVGLGSQAWANGTTVPLDLSLPTTTTEVNVVLPMAKKNKLGITVLDAETSKPVEGAAVSAFKAKHGSYESAQNRGQTGSDGRAELEFAIVETTFVRAQLDGYVPSSVAIERGATSVTLQLHRGTSLTGTVVDPDGKPVADARIMGGYSVPSASESSVYERFKPTSSTATGEFQIAQVPLDQRIHLTASKAGFADSQTLFAELQNTNASKQPFILKLQKPTFFKGRVVDENGSPLRRGIVMLYSSDLTQPKHVTPDDSGRFTIKDIPEGPVAVTIQSSSPPNWFYDLPTGGEEVTLQQGKGATDSGRQIYTRRTGSIVRSDAPVFYGTVVDDETSEPVTDFQVTASTGVEWKRNPEKPGEFTAVGLRAQNIYQYLQVKAPGYTPYDSGTIHIAEGQKEERRTIRLGKGGAVAGIVVDGKTSKPLAGVKVSLSHDEYSSFVPADAMERDTTGPDGRFELKGVGAGRKVVQFKPPAGSNLVERKQDVNTTYQKTADMGEVALGSGGTILGKLVKMPGSVPVSGAIITLSTQKTATTDENGAFSFTNLPNALYSVRTQDPQTLVWVGIEPNETKEISLELGGSSLSGKLTRGGEPVVATVWLQRIGYGMSTSRTIKSDQNGSYLLPAIPPGKWTVSIREDGAAEVAVKEPLVIPEDGKPVEKDFSLPSGALRLRVTDEAGAPVEKVSLRVRLHVGADAQLQPDPRLDKTGADGTAEFTGLPEGDYLLTAVSEKNLRAVKSGVKIASESVVEETLVLKPVTGGTLVSTVVDKDTSAPLPSAWCYLFDTNGEMHEAFFTIRHGNGIMTITDIPPGKYNVHVSALGYSENRHDVEIKDGEDTRIEDALFPAGAVRWAVVDSDGHPAVDLPCTLERIGAGAGEAPITGNTDDRGVFTVRALRPGKYTVTGTGAEGKTAKSEVTIHAGNATDAVGHLK